MSPRGSDEGELPPGSARDPNGGDAPESADGASASPEEPLPPGPSLDRSGRLVPGPGETPRRAERLELEPLAGDLGGQPPRGPDDLAGPGEERASSGHAPLELEHRPKRGEPGPEPVHFGDQVRPRKFKRLIGCLAVLLVLGAVLVAGITLLGRNLAGSGALVVQSEPSGAEVIIDGVRVGTTPFATDNRYAIEAVPIELRHRGYLTWHGVFRGRVDQKLHVRMIRAPVPPPVPSNRAR